MDDRLIALGGAAAALPLGGALLVLARSMRDRTRAATAAVLALALAAALAAGWQWGASDGGGPAAEGSLLRFDGLTALLLPYALALELAIALAAPRRELGPREASRMLLGTSATCALFLTVHPAALAAMWAVTALITWNAAHRAPGGRPAARIYAVAMVPATAMMALGAFLLPQGPAPAAAGAWLVAAAVMVRKGIAPFHSWYPALFRGAPMSTALGATMPQVAAYTAIRLLIGHGTEVPLPVEALSWAALATCAYGAALAIAQRDVRSMVGTLAMSQSALVLAGLAGALPTELCGALAVWVSSGLALTGIALCAWSLESRAGHLRLDAPQGRFADAPVLAAFFLLLGLAAIGLPGTLSFVADDLIVSGCFGHGLGAGLLTIASAVFAGIAVLRAWFLLFGGTAPASGPLHPALPRERAALLAILAFLVALGLCPGPFVRATERAATSFLAPAAEGGHIQGDHSHE